MCVGKMKEAAALKKDGKMLILLQKDCVAAEVMYHRSCHKAYLNRGRNVSFIEAPSSILTREYFFN